MTAAINGTALGGGLATARCGQCHAAFAGDCWKLSQDPVDLADKGGFSS